MTDFEATLVWTVRCGCGRIESASPVIRQWSQMWDSEDIEGENAVIDLEEKNWTFERTSYEELTPTCPECSEGMRSSNCVLCNKPVWKVTDLAEFEKNGAHVACMEKELTGTEHFPPCDYCEHFHEMNQTCGKCGKRWSGDQTVEAK